MNIVKATRTISRLVDDTKNTFRLEGTTIFDDVYGFLTDVLFDISGEVLRFDQDFFRDSKTIRLILSDLSDGEVSEEFELMHKLNKEVEKCDPR